MTGVKSVIDGAVARYPAAIAFVAGLLYPLAFALFDWSLLAVVSLAILFIVIDGRTPKLAARCGFLFGFGAFLAGVYWLYISLRVFGGAPLLLSIPLMLAVIAVMALYSAMFAWLSNTLRPQPGLFRWLLVLPAAWTFFDWLRGWLFSGFPWLATGYSQIDMPLAGLAPVLGVHGVGLAVALSAGVLVVLLRLGPRQRLTAVVVLTILWIGGGSLREVAWTQAAGAATTVTLLQGNVEQDLKWEPEQFDPILERYVAMTAEYKDSDLIIWPEAAIPGFLQEAAVARFVEDLRREVDDNDYELLLGVLDFNLRTKDAYNAAIGIDGELQFYRKRHLVPFGEYFPVPAFVRSWMRLMSLPHSDFQRGDDVQPLIELSGQRIATMICYEVVFGAEQIAYLPAATLLVNISNDAWFGDSIAPHQHLQIAQMRALETGRYLLRATNTGITAAIDPKGVILDRLPQFEIGALTVDLYPYTGATPYVSVGNWPVIGGASVVLLFAAWPVLRHRLS
ncbi:MAG: apolipoprotein N-acyltransferase [Gammaproteobacteria bacterium]